MPVVEMGAIRKHYIMPDGASVDILKSIDLIIEQGEFVALMGHSGAGKSTFMNILGLLDKPTGGVYFLDGEDTGTLNSRTLAKLRNETLGFVFQGFNLIQKRTILDNVALPLMYAGQPHEDSRKRAEYYLGQVGLGAYLKHHPRQLSGGQQQRVAIARALAGEPTLVLADEPTGNLDTKTSHEIMDIFSEINNDGITIILVTHEQDVANFAQRLVMLKDGGIMYDGPML